MIKPLTTSVPADKPDVRVQRAEIWSISVSKRTAGACGGDVFSSRAPQCRTGNLLRNHYQHTLLIFSNTYTIVRLHLRLRTRVVNAN